MTDISNKWCHNGRSRSLRRPSVFLSSTYKDLVFERRFVHDKLEAMGFDVIWMEEESRPGFDWRRWSQNRAGQCDVYVRLFENRIGSQGNALFRRLFRDITGIEERHARDSAMKMVAYELKRPFPDEARLVRAGEGEAYLRSKLERDDVRDSDLAAQVEMQRYFRKGTVVRSVAELERRLEHDLVVNPFRLALHRAVLAGASYFDNTRAAWRRAWQDEHVLMSTDRVGLARQLRVPAILVTSLWLLGVPSLPWRLVLLMTGAFAVLAVLLVVAAAPAFFWAGTKTVVARSVFAFRTVQAAESEMARLEARWGALDDWLDIGALRVVFKDGRRVFVPFVRGASRVRNELETARAQWASWPRV